MVNATDADMQQWMDKIEEKQKQLRDLKEGKTVSLSEEKTQESFDKYLKNIAEDSPCKYMTGVKGIVSLCSNPTFQCKFRNEESYAYHGSNKKECKRESMIKIEKLL